MTGPGVIVAAAGTRAFAGALATAGVDRVVAYHSSVYRQRGLPSVAGLLPWGNANEQTLSLLPEVVAGAGAVPVLATLCANDGLLPRGEALARAADLGARGVLNAPTVGLLEGTVRAVLEREGLGRDCEIALLGEAVAAGLEAWAYVFDRAWTERALDAGATGVIIHLGITGPGGDEDRQRAIAADCLRAVRDAGAPVALVHGGSLRTPADLDALLDALPVELAGRVTGFMGASAFEAADDPVATVAHWRSTLQRSEPRP